MQLDDLRGPFESTDGAALEPEALFSNVQAESARFDREVRLRTAYGAAGFLLPIPLLLFLFLIIPDPRAWHWVLAGGVFVFLVACATIVLVHGLKTHGENVALPIRDFLRRQLARVDRQAKLFRSLKWWFWSPLLVGWTVYVVAFLGGMFERNFFSVLNLFLAPVLAYFGMRAARRYLEREVLPWRTAFNEQLKTLETD